MVELGEAVISTDSPDLCADTRCGHGGHDEWVVGQVPLMAQLLEHRSAGHFTVHERDITPVTPSVQGEFLR